jgi:hypothetical protein
MPSLQNQTLLANGISGTIWPDSPKSDLTKGVNSKETGNEGELSTCFAIRQQSQTMKRTRTRGVPVTVLQTHPLRNERPKVDARGDGPVGVQRPCERVLVEAEAEGEGRQGREEPRQGAQRASMPEPRVAWPAAGVLGCEQAERCAVASGESPTRLPTPRSSGHDRPRCGKPASG